MGRRVAVRSLYRNRPDLAQICPQNPGQRRSRLRASDMEWPLRCCHSGRAVLVGTILSARFGSLAGRCSCLTTNRDQVRVRLAGIDAPELGQPYSRRARSPVGFVFGKDVTLIVQDRDRYGRTVVQVKVADLEVSAELVRIGAAWAYRAYLTDRTLLNLEAVAKEFKRGLCPLSKAERKAPWDWRKAKRGNPVPGTASKRPSPPVASQGGFSCSVIKSCAQMSGCAEACTTLLSCCVRSLSYPDRVITLIWPEGVVSMCAE